MNGIPFPLRLANHDGPTGGKIVRPSDGAPAKKVVMIQCAGSRDVNHLPYCSMICCLASLKHAAFVREQYADAEVDIYYIDIRAHDKMPAFYDRVRSDPWVRFIKSKPGHIVAGEDGRPVVCGEHTLEREIYRTPYDLVVLATGMEPSLGPDFATSAELEKDDYGFVMAHLAEDGGQFSAGVASGPIDVALSTQSATAADLSYDEDLQVRHMCEVIVNEVGVDKLKEQVSNPLTGLKVAGYVGCQTEQFGVRP